MNLIAEQMLSIQVNISHITLTNYTTWHFSNAKVTRLVFSYLSQKFHLYCAECMNENTGLTVSLSHRSNHCSLIRDRQKK